MTDHRSRVRRAVYVAIFLYSFGLVIELIVSGVIGGAWQDRRIRRRVERLEGHYLICGYGRVGQTVAAEFRATGAAYVVVDHDPEALRVAVERGELVVSGNATHEDVIQRGGLVGARGLLACLDSDAENVYLVLTAREVRPDLLIAARASDEDAAKRLRRAGADRVVSPYATAGQALATMLSKPQVAAFLDIVTGGGRPDVRFEEIEVTSACGQQGRSILDLRVRERTAALIVAHRRRGADFDTRPEPDTVLMEGDVLIGFGTADEIRALEDLFAPKESVV